MNNPFVITPEDRQKHAAQFAVLQPVNGFLTGEQARNYFIRSGLPGNVLAHIWNLADLNKDGRMDTREFSIAVCLIQKKLAGVNVPQILPESLLHDPASMGAHMGGMTPGFPPMGVPTPTPAVSMGGAPMGQPMMGGFSPYGATSPMGHMGGGPGGFSMNQPHGYGISPGGMAPMGAQPMQPTGSILPNPNRRVDWVMPPTTKLRHSQMFNTLDKSRIGTLTGAHARNIMSQSGLPHPLLAQIWTLSDVDKDGKLTCDEFCIAMHLIDKVKGGETDLPQVLPPELKPTGRARATSFGSSEMTITGDLVEPPSEAEESPRQQAMTFDERVRQNRDKAQAELERRRQVLLEQERREREERERKDREEEEKRERERQEQERKRQAELEKELARQREIEQMREAERRRIEEQKRAAQEEMEKQRRAEMDRLKLQELQHQRVRDQEAVCHLKQKEKNLTFQVQALLHCRNSNTSESATRRRCATSSKRRRTSPSKYRRYFIAGTPTPASPRPGGGVPPQAKGEEPHLPSTGATSLQELQHQRVRDQEAVCHLKQKEKNLTFQVQALLHCRNSNTSESATRRRCATSSKRRRTSPSKYRRYFIAGTPTPASPRPGGGVPPQAKGEEPHLPSTCATSLQELQHQRVRDQEAVCHLKQKEKNLTFQVQALLHCRNSNTSESATRRRCATSSKRRRTSPSKYRRYFIAGTPTPASPRPGGGVPPQAKGEEPHLPSTGAQRDFCRAESTDHGDQNQNDEYHVRHRIEAARARLPGSWDERAPGEDPDSQSAVSSYHQGWIKVPIRV